jgi:hypothetical protein
MPSNLDDLVETRSQRQIREIQEEFHRLYIHEDMTFKKAAIETGLAEMTIRGFLGRRKDGYQTKNPKGDTILKMADLVGYDIQFVHRKTGKILKPTGRHKRRSKK